MKFVCDKCRTKYSIADEKVRQKVLKIRCKSCANVITVREAVRPPPEPEFDDSATRIEMAPIRPAPPREPARAPAAHTDEWHVACEGKQEGPFTRTALVRKLLAFAPEDEVHIWKEDLDGWKPPAAVPEIARELAGERARAAAKPSAAGQGRPGTAAATGPGGTRPTPLAHRAAPSAGPPPGAPMKRAASGSQASRGSDPAARRPVPTGRSLALHGDPGLAASPMATIGGLGLSAAKRTLPLGAAVAAASEAGLPPPLPPPVRPEMLRLPSAQSGASKPVPGSLPSLRPLPRAVKPAATPAATDLGAEGRLDGAPAKGPVAPVGGALATAGMDVRSRAAAVTAAAAVLDSTEIPIDISESLSLPAGLDRESAPSQAGEPVALGTHEPPAPAPRVFATTLGTLAAVGLKQAKVMRLAIAALALVFVICAIVISYLVITRPEAPIAAPAPQPPQRTLTPEELGAAAAERLAATPIDTAPRQPARAAETAEPPRRVVGPGNSRSPAARAAPTKLSAEEEAKVKRFADGGRATSAPVTAAPKAPAVSPEAVNRVFKQNQGSIKACYDRALTRDKSLTRGRIDVTVTIGVSGRVKRVSLRTGSEFRLMEPCVREAVARWAFPSAGEEYDATFPFIFQGE